jgi:hypothetical protein
VSEWTDAETKAWEKEQQTSKEALADMDERVHKAVQQEFRRDPAAVSKKTEEATKSTEYGRATGQKTGSELGGTGGGIPHGEPEDRQRFRSWNPV